MATRKHEPEAAFKNLALASVQKNLDHSRKSGWGEETRGRAQEKVKEVRTLAEHRDPC